MPIASGVPGSTAAGAADGAGRRRRRLDSTSEVTLRRGIRGPAREEQVREGEIWFRGGDADPSARKVDRSGRPVPPGRTRSLRDKPGSLPVGRAPLAPRRRTLPDKDGSLRHKLDPSGTKRILRHEPDPSRRDRHSSRTGSSFPPGRGPLSSRTGSLPPGEIAVARAAIDLSPRRGPGPWRRGAVLRGEVLDQTA